MKTPERTKRSRRIRKQARHSARSDVAELVTNEYAVIDKLIDGLSIAPEKKCQLRYRDSERLAEDTLSYSADRKRHLLLQFKQLKRRILLGYMPELLEVVDMAQHSTRLLDELADEHPDILALVAGDYDEWPLMVTLSSAAKKEKERLSCIGLGQGRSPYLAKTKSPAGLWAKRLYRFMQFVRSVNGVVDSGSPTHYSSQDDMGCAPFKLGLLIDRKQDAMKRRNTEFPEPVWLPLKGRITDLPSPEEDRKAWWRVAEEILLLHSENKPWQLEGLYNYGPSDIRRAGLMVGTDESAMRAWILQRVKDAFIRLV